MQEFSSVSASAYDADALTTQLNEKAGEGWDVVSIVSAGSNVVAYLSRESTGEEPAPEPEVEPAAEPEAEAIEEETPPVEEPAGWAAAPDATDPTPTDTAAAATGAAVAGAAVAEAPAEPAAADPAAEEPAAEPAAEEAPAEEPAAAESAVPAGWYADPSGRFELRYWDGAAWTEHVSRAGQQETDPPVA